MKIIEILQTTKGLSKTDNQHHSAPGFDWNNSIDVLTDEYHAGYEKFVLSFKEKYPFGNTNFAVLELGCGGGNLSYFFRKHFPNCVYVTVDINADTIDSPYINPETHFTKYTDQLFRLIDDSDKEGLEFDFIFSFEHFEHIPPKTLPILLNNIKYHSYPGTTILATASKINSPVHVSVFTQEQWEIGLQKFGFKMLPNELLTPENCPPNFDFYQTIPLCFTINENE